MLTQNALLIAMRERSLSLGYRIEEDAFGYTYFDKKGLIIANIRKFTVDYTISQEEFDRYLKKLK